MDLSRIAVFQIDHPLQASTRDLVNALVKAGFAVDLFTTTNADRGFVDVRTVTTNVEYLDGQKRWVRLALRLRNGIASRLGVPLSINPLWFAAAAWRQVRSRGHYDLFIGIEKAGVALAAFISEKRGTPFVYWSLELYLEGHPNYRRFGWQRADEIASHSRAAGTIIQDEVRWASLARANGIRNNRVFFLPVGTASSSAATVIDSQPVGSSTILYVGIISQSRFSRELVTVAADFPEWAMLQLHGPMFDDKLTQALSSKPQSKVRISTDLLDENDLYTLVAHAHIGLALYNRSWENDRHTAFASQKVALYLECGVPIIVFKSETYKLLFSKFRCGEAINDIAELPQAIERIHTHFSEYSANARAAWDAIYDLDNYWPPLVNFLRGLSARGRNEGI